MRKTTYPTRALAQKWIRKHNYKPTFNPDPNPESENWWRFRQRKPSDFKQSSFRIFRYNDSVHFVIGQL